MRVPLHSGLDQCRDADTPKLIRARRCGTIRWHYFGPYSIGVDAFFLFLLRTDIDDTQGPKIRKGCIGCFTRISTFGRSTKTNEKYLVKRRCIIYQHTGCTAMNGSHSRWPLLGLAVSSSHVMDLVRGDAHPLLQDGPSWIHQSVTGQSNALPCWVSSWN